MGIWMPPTGAPAYLPTWLEWLTTLTQCTLVDTELVEMKDVVTDEDCLDDPIRLIDVHQERYYNHSAICNHRKQETVSIDLTDSDVDVVTVEQKKPTKLAVTFFNLPKNVKLYEKCKPFSIKVVDCNKYPWFYKKYLYRLNMETDGCIEISDSDVDKMEMRNNNKNNSSVDISDDDERDIMLPLVSFSKLILSPNSGKPKIRPVDISSYYSTGNLTLKSKTFLDKPNKKNVEKEVHQAEPVKKNNSSRTENYKKPHNSQSTCTKVYKLEINDSKSTNVDLKKNIGLVGLRIKECTEKPSFKLNSDEKKHKSKGKKKSKKHKDKKQYSSIPVIHIEGNTTKESLKISLNKNYVKKKFLNDLFEANNNSEDVKPVIVNNLNTIEDKNEIHKNEQPSIEDKNVHNAKESASPLSNQHIVTDSDTCLLQEKKVFKNNIIPEVEYMTKNIKIFKQKTEVGKKIKKKFDELFKQKPKNEENDLKKNEKKSKAKQVQSIDESLKKSNEITHRKTTNINDTKEDVFKSKPISNLKKSESITSLLKQQCSTLIFRDNDQKEVLKIHSALNKKKSENYTSVSIPIQKDIEQPANKSLLPYKGNKNDKNNVEFNKKVKTVSPAKCDISCDSNKEPLKNINLNPNCNSNKEDSSMQKITLSTNKPLTVARHIMPPQIARPGKETINKKTNNLKNSKANTKKSDQCKLNPNVPKFIKNFGIDITHQKTLTKTSVVVENEVAKITDHRKTLPDMPNLEKPEKVTEDNQVTLEVFTHKSKEEKLLVSVQKIPDLLPPINSSSQDTNINIFPDIVNKNKVAVDRQGGNLMAQLKSNNGLIGNSNNLNNKAADATNKSEKVISEKYKGDMKVRSTKTKKPSKVTMKQINGKNILRSDGAACNQIVLNKKTNNPLVSINSMVSQIPFNPYFNNTQSAGFPYNYNPINTHSTPRPHLNPPNVNPGTANMNFQNMQPMEKLALSVDKLDQPIQCHFRNDMQMHPIQTVITNRPSISRPRFPEADNRFNLQSFEPRQPAFLERPRMDFNINYPPSVRAVPIQQQHTYPPMYGASPNGVPYDIRYNPHQNNFCPQQNPMVRLPPPPIELPYNFCNNVAPKMHEGSKVIGQNIHGVIRTINLTAPSSLNGVQDDSKIPSSNDSERLVKSKEEMFQELTKEMANVDNNSRTLPKAGTTDIRCADPKAVHIGSKRPLEDFSKYGPMPKKSKEFDKPDLRTGPTYPVNDSRLNNVNLESTPSIGYSPPILPIPTYEKTFELLSQPASSCPTNIINQQPMYAQAAPRTTEAQTLAPLAQTVTDRREEIKLNQTEVQTPRPITYNNNPNIEEKRRISIEEYKKRVNPDDKDGNDETVSVKIENPEIKNEPLYEPSREIDGARRQSADLDLGYDSDSTLRI